MSRALPRLPLPLPVAGGGVASAALAVLVACACGGTDTAIDDAVDGGVDGARERPGSSGGASSGGAGSSGSSGATSDGDGGAPGPLAKVTLKSGAAIVVGITSDAQVVYVTLGGNATSLEAVPVSGGAPTVIDPDLDVGADETAVVSGGVVGYWKVVTDGVGTFNAWTKASGARTALSTTSAVGIFAGSDDGSRVAFSVGATATTSDIAVTSTASPSATPVLTGVSAMNLAAATPDRDGNASCAPDIGFVGKRLFAAYCPGTGAGAVAARLYTVAEGAAAPVRLDANGGAAGTLRPVWHADRAGAKVFAVTSNALAAGRIFDVASPGAPLATLDGEVTNGFMLDDGSAAVYHTALAASPGVRRAAAAAQPAPVTLVANAELLDWSADRSRVVVSTVPPDGILSDLRIADTKTPGQTPRDLVTTATALPIAFTGTGAHYVYVTDVGDTGNTLAARPVTGGPEIVLGRDVSSAGTAPVGDAVVLLDHETLAGDVALHELRVATATQSASAVLVDDSVTDGFFFAGGTLVYTRLSNQGGGVFAVTLP